MMVRMAVMNRLSNLFYVLLGAVAVGAVVAVLAVSGALPDKVERTTTETTTTPQSTTPAALDAKPTSVADIYRKVSGSVVFVSARGGNGTLGFNGQGGGKAASGSGFVVDTAGHIVTNDHVVENADKFTVRFGEHGNPITAKLVGKDPSSDIAVLSINPNDIKNVKPLQLASSKNLRPGQAAIAIGSPFGLSGTVTTGIISALGREIQAPNGFSIPGAVQTDAAINPGNSGGPLLDAAGRVIGVNSQIASSGGGNTGVGFAIPVDSIRDVVPKLVADGHIDRAYLGLASSERPATPGALVGTVNSGTPAADAGIRTGDLIVGLDGKTIRSPSELSLAVLQKKPGDSVRVELKRGGSTKTVTVKLGRRPNQVAQ
jgi:S1-C subfamily serine protease